MCLFKKNDKYENDRTTYIYVCKSATGQTVYVFMFHNGKCIKASGCVLISQIKIP